MALQVNDAKELTAKAAEATLEGWDDFLRLARRCSRSPAGSWPSRTARDATESGSLSHGLDILSIDFSPSAQKKARTLAAERHVNVAFQQVDVHTWDYPEAAFDVVVEIFTQFSSPAERALKWTGMRRALKPGGLLIIQGYTPNQREYGTGGPKQAENLYTRSMLEDDFRGYRDLNIVEEEREIYEGTSHSGMSAVINFTARKS